MRTPLTCGVGLGGDHFALRRDVHDLAVPLLDHALEANLQAAPVKV